MLADAPIDLSLLATLLYWAVPPVLVLASGTWWLRWRASPAPLRALVALWPGLLSAFALVAIVFTLSPPTLRVQFDETSLVGASQTMHEQRQALMTTGAVPFEGQVMGLERTVDKRPPLFAFLVSAVHDLTGERIANAFVVNAALLALGLLLVFAAVRVRLGLPAALAAQLLVVSVPLTAITATSAGFELLATVLFLGVVLAALDFVLRPDRLRALVLLATGGVFAQARYESLPALLLVLALAWWIARRSFRIDARVVAMVAVQLVLAVPVVLLLDYARSPKFYPEAGGEPLLAAQHVAAHLGPFLVHWLLPSLANPLPGLLAWAALAAVVARFVRRRVRATDPVPTLPVAAVTALALLWFYGDVHEPTALRLFLPAAWLSALLPLAAWSTPLARRAGWLLLAAALLFAGLRLREVARGATFPSLAIAEQTAALDRALDGALATSLAANGADPAHTLWVTTLAQHLVLHGRAALAPSSFAARAGDIQQLVGDGHVRAILVVETSLDAVLAGGFGDPRDVLRATRSEVVATVPGDRPITVHRVLLR